MNGPMESGRLITAEILGVMSYDQNFKGGRRTWKVEFASRWGRFC
jgi:hypothetical protein